VSSNKQPPGARYLLLLLLISYPLSLHFSIYYEYGVTRYIVLAALVLLVVYALLCKSRYFIVPGTIAALIVYFLLIDSPIFSKMIYWPPVLLPLTAAILFGRTLLPGQTSLITRFAMLMDDQLSEDERRYTRLVTWAWLMCFIFLIIESILLAVFAPVEVWSFFTNIINYLIIVCVFVLEYFLRIRKFSHKEHKGFFAFLVSLAKIDFRSLTRQG